MERPSSTVIREAQKMAERLGDTVHVYALPTEEPDEIAYHLISNVHTTRPDARYRCSVTPEGDLA